MNDSVPALRDQLQQLKALHGAGALDAQAYATSKAALERRLVDLVVASPDATTATATVASSPRVEPVRSRKGLWAGAAVCAALLAAGGYFWTGTPGTIGQPPEGFAGTERAADGAASAPHALDQSQIAAMTDRLAQRLKTQPDDGEGWGMLGRSYMALGRHADALAAYERAIKLRPRDAATLADYADALAVKNGRDLAGEPTRLIELALEIEPDNLKALSLAGTAAFNRKDYARAVQHWDRAVQVGSPDNAMVQQARSSAAEARELGKLPAAGALN